MAEQISFKCDEHPDPFDCPDNLISYSSKFDEYGIIVHDGGSSVSIVKFCPWCGAKLPDSRRDQWFNELDKLGFDDPWEQDIPEKFKSDAWYRNPQE